MAFKPANCPKCGGSLQIPDDKDIVNCMYCGESIVVREVLKVQTQANLENLFRLADSAAEANNNQEAYNYYTQILEYDGRNADAWFGKAVSKGYCSNLISPLTKEMISSFERCFECVPSKDLQSYKNNAGNKILDFCTMYFDAAKQHWISEIVTLDLWTKFIVICDVLIEGLDKAYSWNPHNVNIAKLIINICSFMISGVSSDFGELFGVTPEAESKLRQNIDQYTAIIRGKDKNYTPPIIDKQLDKQGACYIATYVYGDYDYPDVKLLRKFRDRILLRFKFGKKFVEFYYIVSPVLLRYAGDSDLLKLCFKICILKPLISLLLFLRFDKSL